VTVGRAVESPARSPRRRLGARASYLAFRRRNELGATGALVLMFGIFGYLNSDFLTVSNFGGILTVAAELGILAVGEGLLMISAEIDISISAVFTLGAVVMASLLNAGVPGGLALLGTLAFGAGAGMLNGIVTVRFGIPSLITTLGTLALWTGITLWKTAGYPTDLQGTSQTLDVISGHTALDLTLHVSVFWWLGALCLLWLVLERSSFGNWVYATGGKAAAARAVGVPVARVKMINFVVCGMTAAFAGVVNLGRIQSISPDITSNNLSAIAAVVIGGVSIWGGIGTAAGIALGTLAISSIDIGLISAGAPSFWFQAFVGGVILAVVIINKYINEFMTARFATRPDRRAARDGAR
jgi:ribose/xylose/arabinose/galactoside ABC-type transport system permease subunit